MLFLDKMVNTILSRAFRAGRQWRREMYGLRLGAAMPLTAGPRFHKTVFNRYRLSAIFRKHTDKLEFYDFPVIESQ